MVWDKTQNGYDMIERGRFTHGASCSVVLLQVVPLQYERVIVPIKHQQSVKIFRPNRRQSEAAVESLPTQSRLPWYNGAIMASHHISSPPAEVSTISVSQICADVKNLGYAASGRIRLYGEDFEVISDPFPEADGIAVRVKTKKDSRVRVLQLPSTILQSVRGRRVKSAA